MSVKKKSEDVVPAFSVFTTGLSYLENIKGCFRYVKDTKYFYIF